MDQFERKLSDPIWYIFVFDEMSVLTGTISQGLSMGLN